MVKYHISESGEPNPCEAKVKCRLGGESGKENHFDTFEEAQKFSEEKLSKEFSSNLKGTKKPSSKESKEITLPSPHGLFKVKDGDLDDHKARLALVSGLCADLALAIHDKTGAEPYFLCFSYDSEEEFHEAFENDPEAVFDATHVVTLSQNKQNHFVDSYGVKSIRDLMEFWGEDITIIEGNRDMLLRYGDADSARELGKFADSAIELDKEGKSYEYEDIDEYEDF